MSEILPIPDASTFSPPPAEPMLIDARAFARLLGVSLATLNRMKAGGKLPRHIALSAGCHRWRSSEVRDWIGAGCPAIKEWDVRRRAEKGGRR